MAEATEIRSKLAQLAQRFIVRTREELGALTQHIGRARDGDAKSLAEVRNLAHRMHGTGATLGFADVAEAAARLEKLAETAPADFDAMSSCVVEMERRLSEAASRNGTDGAPGRS